MFGFYSLTLQVGLPIVVAMCVFCSEFFERTILCNSLVWSCAVTGKPGLTYQEALESERRAKQSLQSFPSSLVVPLLHLTALTHRSRLHEMCDDVYAYVKERYFPGEMVDLVARSGARLVWILMCISL